LQQSTAQIDQSNAATQASCIENIWKHRKK